ncbi:MAG: glycosyltransferase family 2 protein [Alphaproteobacteria bacterium]
MRAPRLSIIVLSYNRIEAMRDCLASIRALDYPDVEVVVVDNASTNEAPEMIAREFPEVRLYRAERNLGICEGRNAAVRLTTGEYLWVLDNDITIVDPQAARQLVALLEADPSLGVIGGEAALDARGRVVGTKDLRMTVNGMVRGRMLLDRPAWALARTNMLEGCNMFMRRALFVELGGFDPGCLFHWDDNDFCYRVERRGLKVAVVGRSPVVHHYVGAARKLMPWRNGRSRMYFVLKNYPWWQIAALPLLDLAFLFNPLNPVRFVDKARRLAFGGKSGVVTLDADAEAPRGRPDWAGAARRALAYAETILAGYVYLLPTARAAFAARRSPPDSLAATDMSALHAPAPRPDIDDGAMGWPKVVNG